MVKHKALGNSPVLGWITDTSNLNKKGIIKKTSKQDKKHISIKADKHISSSKEKIKSKTSKHETKKGKTKVQVKPEIQHKSIKADKHISRLPVSDKSKKKGGKVHISIWVIESMWESIKEKSIKTKSKISDFVAKELENKANLHISIKADKHINSSRKGKVQLSLFLPESLLTAIKLQALGLRVPYSVLIIEKLNK